MASGKVRKRIRREEEDWEKEIESVDSGIGWFMIPIFINTFVFKTWNSKPSWSPSKRSFVSHPDPNRFDSNTVILPLSKTPWYPSLSADATPPRSIPTFAIFSQPNEDSNTKPTDSTRSTRRFLTNLRNWCSWDPSGPCRSLAVISIWAWPSSLARWSATVMPWSAFDTKPMETRASTLARCFRPSSWPPPTCVTFSACTQAWTTVCSRPSSDAGLTCVPSPWPKTDRGRSRLGPCGPCCPAVVSSRRSSWSISPVWSTVNWRSNGSRCDRSSGCAWRNTWRCRCRSLALWTCWGSFRTWIDWNTKRISTRLTINSRGSRWICLRKNEGVWKTMWPIKVWIIMASGISPWPINNISWLVC